MHTYLAYVVESYPGSLDGSVISLDRDLCKCVDFEYLNSFVMSLSFVFRSFDSMGYLYYFLSLFFFLFFFCSCFFGMASFLSSCFLA
jgi:hypothetical protein